MTRDAAIALFEAWWKENESFMSSDASRPSERFAFLSGLAAGLTSAEEIANRLGLVHNIRDAIRASLEELKKA